MQTSQAGPDLAHPVGRHAGDAEERLEIGGGALAVGAAGLLHGAGRLGGAGGQPVAGERQAERRAHRRGHTVVVQEHERVPGVEENRAQGQRNRSSAPSPSMASRASGSYTTFTSTPWRSASSIASSTTSSTGIGLALAAAFPLGQRQTAGLAAAEAGLARVGVHQQRADLARARARGASA